MTKHKFSYNWNLSNGYPANGVKYHGSKVFSCFACGGGSTMGYKLAGYDVVGMNEIDHKMADCYIANHKPKFAFIEPIQEFKKRQDLPNELFKLDILDGSPPCSSFSMVGNRKKDWGKKKKFREGQANQILDTLFFDFIDLAKRLQPKVVIAENVEGILFGEAKKYVKKIYECFDKAGYYCQHWLLDASKMGVPQRRRRVFFICLRKDLAEPFLRQQDFFTFNPILKLNFNEPEVKFKDICNNEDKSIKDNTVASKFWDLVNYGESFRKAHPNGHFFGETKSHPDLVLPTITTKVGSGSWHYTIKRPLNDLELKKAGSFPLDYDFCGNKTKYLIGMSVPPVMIAQIATEVYKQWIRNIKIIKTEI